MIGLLTFLAVAWVLRSILLLLKTTDNNKALKAPTLDKTILYSWARIDRSGSAIHDMLMAHAYSYSIEKGDASTEVPVRRVILGRHRETPR